MKTNIEHFSPIGSEELLETNGGGFAYDFGRVLRYFAIAMPGNMVSIANANVDWIITDVLNDL